MSANEKIPQPSSNPGAWLDTIRRLKLVWRLLLDDRVLWALKIIPLGALGYLIWPMDVIPDLVFPLVGALDDMAILWLGLSLFVELCPPDVVAEHKRALGLLPPKPPGQADVIDAEVHDINE